MEKILVENLNPSLLNMLGINNKIEPVAEKVITNLYHPFKLPIHYIHPSEVFPLSKTVSDDLELLVSDSTSMYEHLFQPSNSFAKQMLQEWNSHYTTNIDFLKDTQDVLREIPPEELHPLDCSNIMSIWNDLKDNKNFLEKYNFVEWKMLMHLNESPLFLQIMSMANIMSPIMTLLIPLLFLLVPFIILKLQQKHITFDVYVLVLKQIAKNHFIGKTISSMQSMNIENIFYIGCSFAFYLMQVYQNMILCSRFYKNIQLINQRLIDIGKYIESTRNSMNQFIGKHYTKKCYTNFCKDIQTHSIRLQELYNQIEDIGEFKYNSQTLGNVGYMLKQYYVLHSNIEFEESLRYSIGFVGYIDNMKGVYDNIQKGQLSFANFDKTKNVEIKDQFYPPLKDNKDVIKNDCDLKKNMIITGVNGSGKTTFIKTTALNIIFTQQLGCGFYKSCLLNPYEHIHSYLNIPDTSERDSLFQAESRRCKNIINIINENPDARHFCIFDELYSGTNIDDATKASYSFLVYLCKRKNINFVLTTHIKNVCKKLRKIKDKCGIPMMKNCKMDVIEHLNYLEYTYKIKKGICKINGAIHILQQMQYPDEILETFKNYNNNN